MLGTLAHAPARREIVPGLRTPTWYGSEEDAWASSMGAAAMLGARRARK